jgi:peptidase E
MNIILTSEFISIAKHILNKWYFKQIDKKVAFIQNATDNRLDKWETIERLESAKQRYKDNNFNLEIIDLRKYNDSEELYKELSNYNYIHIHGWDIKHLSSVAQESWLYECIRKLLSQWITYIGSSAWSILTWNEISYARIAEPKYTEWKWIIPTWSIPWLWLQPFHIMPHANKIERQEVAVKRLEYCIANNYNPYITLTDYEVIIFNNDGTINFI